MTLSPRKRVGGFCLWSGDSCRVCVDLCILRINAGGHAHTQMLKFSASNK